MAQYALKQPFPPGGVYNVIVKWLSGKAVKVGKDILGKTFEFSPYMKRSSSFQSLALASMDKVSGIRIFLICWNFL